MFDLLQKLESSKAKAKILKKSKQIPSQPVEARANGHYGQCPPPKNKWKEKLQLSYNSEKNIECYILACFTRHSGARDSITSHCVDLSLICKHFKNDVLFWAN